MSWKAIAVTSVSIWFLIVTSIILGHLNYVDTYQYAYKIGWHDGYAFRHRIPKWNNSGTVYICRPGDDFCEEAP